MAVFTKLLSRPRQGASFTDTDTCPAGNLWTIQPVSNAERRAAQGTKAGLNRAECDVFLCGYLRLSRLEVLVEKRRR
jgi:hypothetical protein